MVVSAKRRDGPEDRTDWLQMLNVQNAVLDTRSTVDLCAIAMPHKSYY